jgi:DNA polymerase epsilon subunit 4
MEVVNNTIDESKTQNDDGNELAITASGVLAESTNKVINETVPTGTLKDQIEDEQEEEEAAVSDDEDNGQQEEETVVVGGEEESNDAENTDVQVVVDDKEASTTKAVSLKGNNNKQIQLAVSRIKSIMKMDPDFNLVGKDSLFLVTKATELFIEFLSVESHKSTINALRKTIQKKDIEAAVNEVDSLCFLDAALD